MKNNSDSLRKYLNSKPPYKLYAYIYRSHITKKQILKCIKNMESEFEYIRSLTMMQLCCYYKDDVIESIVDIKLSYLGRMNPSCRLVKQINYKGYTINVICMKLAETKSGLIYHERCTCTIRGIYEENNNHPRPSLVPRMFKSIYSAKKYIDSKLIKEKNNEKIN